MKLFTPSKIAYLIPLFLAGTLTACGGEDGKDGADGAPGVPGEPAKPPVTTSSTVTNVNVIHYAFGEGTVSYEFEITDQDGKLITGLTNAEAKVAALTDKGFINNRTESDIDGVADNVHIGGAATQATEGATLTMIEDGHYQFVAPMAGVNAGTEGIVWLRVGGNASTGIARSNALVVNKPEGSMSTTTESCYSCHVDYATSPLKHSSYVATGMDGEVTFVEGCLTCHGSVSRAVTNEQGFSTGGYATNTLSKIGHVNHQEFTRDFSVMNCTSCHAEAPKNINIAGPGCIDCHDTGGVPGSITPNNGADLRILHESKGNITANKAIHANYAIKGTPLTRNENGAWCTTMSLYQVDAAGAETLVDLHALVDDTQTVHNAEKPINYTGSYLHGVYNDSVVGRISNSYDYSYEADGSKTMCYASAVVDLTNWSGAGLMASLRVSFTSPDYAGSDSDVVTLHAYTDVTNPLDDSVTAYQRRLNVADNSCTTCHNSQTNFHKNGAYAQGGLGCIACHNNGQDRRAGGAGPGFGPLVHSLHFGIGSVDDDGVENSAAKALNPQTSCVACHSNVVDLKSIPNQFIKARSYGVDNKMASPVTANCYACHNTDDALSHMKQNGGTLTDDVPASGQGTEWYQMGTQEACATCHAEGSSFGIEKFHNFKTN